MRIIFAGRRGGPAAEITDRFLEAAVEAGDIDPATITPLTARIGPGVDQPPLPAHGEPPNRRELALVVDT